MKTNTIIIYTVVTKNFKEYITIRDYDKIDPELLVNGVYGIDWRIANHSTDINDQIGYFNDKILFLIDNYVPRRVTPKKNPITLWFDTVLLNKMNRFSHLYRGGPRRRVLSLRYRIIEHNTVHEIR